MAWSEYYYRWEWELGGTPEALWPYVSDTNRFNADVGLGHLTVNERVQDGLGRRLRFYQFGLVPIEWIEEPFDWVYARSFGVLRKYTLGPVEEMRVFTTLTPVGDDRTQLVYEVWARPRNVLGWISIPLVIGIKSQRDFGRAFEMYSDWVQHQEVPSDHLMGKTTFAPQGRERLENIKATLALEGLDTTLIDKLGQFITRGDEMDLAELRPYALADQWGVPRSEMLELFLQATKNGLLDMEWQLLCPMCRGANDNVASSLDEINQGAHCPSCLIEYEVNFEQGVELIFRPNPAVRPISPMSFCVGGPQITPHIVAQQVLEPEERRRIEIMLGLGRYRARQGSDDKLVYFRVDENGESELIFQESLTQIGSHEYVLSPTVAIDLHNPSAEPEQIIIERTEWSDTALTAAEVIANQGFRDLFSEQALRPDAQFSVGQTTILFTDLVGSTQMYNEIGDAPAFGLVLNHFDILKEAIAEHDGAIVKTIGDAVMAGFREPAKAMQAILVAQERLQEMDAERDMLLKASIHIGGCIAVTLNERLDYFGSTVNIAARLEGFAKPNVTVVSDEVYQDPGVQRFFKENPAAVEINSFHGQLKGFGERPFQLWRIRNAKVNLVEETEAKEAKVRQLN